MDKTCKFRVVPIFFFSLSLLYIAGAPPPPPRPLHKLLWPHAFFSFLFPNKNGLHSILRKQWPSSSTSFVLPPTTTSRGKHKQLRLGMLGGKLLAWQQGWRPRKRNKNWIEGSLFLTKHFGLPFTLGVDKANQKLIYSNFIFSQPIKSFHNVNQIKLSQSHLSNNKY